MTVFGHSRTAPGVDVVVAVSEVEFGLIEGGTALALCWQVDFLSLVSKPTILGVLVDGTGLEGRERPWDCEYIYYFLLPSFDLPVGVDLVQELWLHLNDLIELFSLENCGGFVQFFEYPIAFFLLKSWLWRGVFLQTYGRLLSVVQALCAKSSSFVIARRGPSTADTVTYLKIQLHDFLGVSPLRVPRAVVDRAEI